MSALPTTPGPAAAPSRRLRDRLRRLWPYALLGVLMVVLAAVTVGPVDGLPLDPASTGPDGTAALVAVLRDLGAEVTVVDEPSQVTGETVLVLRDPGAQEWTAAIEDALAREARVVVTDPGSPLTPPAGDTFATPAAGPDCGLDALADVDRITARGFTSYEVPEGAVGCFRIDDARAWLVADARDGGTLVALAGAGPLTNAALDDADNALLAVGLLGGGGRTVSVVGPRVAVLAADGDATLLDLLPDRVRAGLLQLLVALLVVVVWRWRRLGAPVSEELPVELSGAELVVAEGELLDQADAHGHAAGLLAAALQRDLALRVGLPPSAPTEQVAAAGSDVVGTDPGTLAVLLDPASHGRLPTDGDALVRYARRVSALRRAAGLGADAAGLRTDPDRPADRHGPPRAGVAARDRSAL